VLIDVLYSITAACIWLRVVYALRLTRFLGPLIKMVQLMIRDILVFLILFGCDLIIFASIGNMLFVSIEEYSTLNVAMVTLFTSALGGFDFGVLKNSNKGQWTG
jgi:hypothetical protein